jgi:hypothetical protein
MRVVVAAFDIRPREILTREILNGLDNVAAVESTYP